jgi:RNA polymerase sigma factor (sigma-70 family)
MTDTQPSVYIVDDDHSVRNALARIIESAGYPVETFSSASTFLQSDAPQRRGCLVLDVRMPEVDGLELQQRLRTAGTAMPVVFMTGFTDVSTTVKAMKAGAIDFLPKPVSDQDLLTAVDSALAEEARLRTERAESERLRQQFERLTPREKQVFQLVVIGRLNKQIALELGISEKTVKVHRGRVMEKLGVRRVAQLVRLAARMGLAPADQAVRPSNAA